MMAAGRAAELGSRVLLLEKNDRPGEKLLITGGGRSNITNHQLHVRTFLEKFSDSAKFLFSPFAQFAVKDTLNFFHALGMDTKLEAEGRVFPATEKAETVQQTLIAYMKRGGVTLRVHAEVAGLVIHNHMIEGVELAGGEVISARSVILATGGRSHPETGSTGDGFRFLSTLGHHIQKSEATLVPVRTKEAWGHKFSGLAFSDAKVTLAIDKIKSDSAEGKILFTHFGLSGPLILNMSSRIKSALEEGKVTLSIDLFPKLDNGVLDRMIQEIFRKDQNKQLKNTLGDLLPSRISSLLPEILALDGEKEVNKVAKEERQKIVKWLKAIPITPTGLLGAQNAIVTSGGVPLEEVEMSTMRSLYCANLYLVGDILDIDRPSGGYSLQLCWTTGWVAGNHAGNRSNDTLRVKKQ